MNKILITALFATTLTFTACGNGGKGGNSKFSTSKELPTEVQSAIDSTPSTLSQELTNTLSYMGNEERLAYDVYNRLYKEWGTKQFTNIATKSEYKHIESVQKLIQKYKLNDKTQFTNIDKTPLSYINSKIEDMQAGIYDISKVQTLYDDLVSSGLNSQEEALKVGCTIEVVDIDDLDKYIKIAEDSNAQDVITVFNFLRDGSYKHYWAFDKGLKKIGFNDGCCTWSQLCHTEYPQNKK